MRSQINQPKNEERLVLRLDRRIPAENELANLYQSLPRARRQEMMRRALTIGFKHIKVEISGGAP